MPFFDFECTNCKNIFSELVFGSETISCPKCSSVKLKKLLSGFYTVSDSTRFESHAKDLPSMEQWAKTKNNLGKEKPKKDPLAQLKTMKKLKGKPKVRAAVKHRKK